MLPRQASDIIATAASVLNLRVRVTEGSEWAIEHGVVVVGADTYARSRLHGDALAAAVLLDLWAGPYFAIVSGRRFSRRATLDRERPELDPLLSTIDRLQAAGELLVALPGFRAALAVAIARRFAGDVTAEPATTQLLAHTLVQVCAPHARVAVAENVRVRCAPTRDLRVAVTPLHPADRVRTFDRILALTLPRYEELLHERSPGLGADPHGRDRDAMAEPIDTDLDLAAAAAGGGSEAESSEGSHEGDADGEAGDDEQSRPGDSREAAEGADLHEAWNAGEVTEFLETPLRSETMSRALRELDAAEQQGVARRAAHEATPAFRAQEEVRLRRYLEQVDAHAGEIEALREVWRALVAERITEQRRMGRRAERDGETLLLTALPAAVAEARAGVPRPRAYARRERLLREEDEFGDTDFVLLIDRSGSMREAAPHAAAAALVMIEALAAASRDVRDEERRLGVDLRLNLRTSLIVFDAEPVVVKPMSTASDDAIRSRLMHEALVTGGGTNDARALREAAKQLGLIGEVGGETGPLGTLGEPSRGPRKRVVIVVSDGGSNEPEQADAALNFLRSRGVTVYGIGVRSDELVLRYAPTARRVDDPRDIVRVMESLIAQTASGRATRR